MKLWTRLITLRFFRIFLVLQLATICLYISTDLLFKLDFFTKHPQQLLGYYTLHLLPLSLATFPILSFLSLGFVQSQLRQKREWHLAQQIRASPFQRRSPYLYITLCLVSSWIYGREVLHPKYEPALEQYRQLIKGASTQAILLENKTGAHLLSWDFSSNLLTKRSLVKSVLGHGEEWEWDSYTEVWNSKMTNKDSLPKFITPNWLQDQSNKLGKSILQLLKEHQHGEADLHTNLELGQRLGLPIVFAILFILCAHWTHSMRSNLWACAWPVVQLTSLAFIMVQWRFSGLAHGLFIGSSMTLFSFIAILWVGHKISRTV
jgi:hypothetical protein